MTARYVGLARAALGRRRLFFAVYGAIVVVLALLFLRLPTSFLPTDDMGQLMVQYELPPGATAERTEAVRRRIIQHFIADEPKTVTEILAMTGFSFAGSTRGSRPWPRSTSARALISRLSRSASGRCGRSARSATRGSSPSFRRPS